MERKTDNYLVELKTGVILLDRNLKITYINNSAESMLDTSIKSSLNKHLSSTFYEEPDCFQRFEDCLEKKENFSKFDAVLFLKGGRKLLCDYHLNLNFEKKAIKGLVLEIYNKEYSSEIKERLRMQTNQQVTTAFVRGLAHEIKNPLSGIRGAAQLLSQKLPKQHLAEYTNIIIGQTDRLTSLVDNMLGPKRKPSFEIQNIHFPIENVLVLVKQEFNDLGLKLTKDFDPSIPELMMDSFLLEQGILNLLRNSKESLMQSSTSAPKIKVITRVLHQEFVGDTKQNTVCRITIKDNGPGISEEIKESIFFPMISGKESGSGLGLSITQGIVSQHKGTIQFNSKPGETDFSILMPILKNGIENKFLKKVHG